MTTGRGAMARDGRETREGPDDDAVVHGGPLCGHCGSEAWFVEAGSDGGDHARWVCACGADVRADARTGRPIGPLVAPKLRSARRAYRGAIDDAATAMTVAAGILQRRRCRIFEKTWMRARDLVLHGLAQAFDTTRDTLEEDRLSIGECRAAIAFVTDTPTTAFAPPDWHLWSRQQTIAWLYPTLGGLAARLPDLDRSEKHATWSRMIVGDLWNAEDDEEGVGRMRIAFRKRAISEMNSDLARLSASLWKLHLPGKFMAKSLSAMGLDDGLAIVREALIPVRRTMDAPDVSRRTVERALFEAFEEVWSRRTGDLIAAIEESAATGDTLRGWKPGRYKAPDTLFIAAAKTAKRHRQIEAETIKGPAPDARAFIAEMAAIVTTADMPRKKRRTIAEATLEGIAEDLETALRESTGRTDTEEAYRDAAVTVWRVGSGRDEDGCRLSQAEDAAAHGVALGDRGHATND